MRGSRLRRERRSLSQGSDGWGLIPGPIWPCLASFTPTVEAGNGATVASFGPPLTRRHRASWLWLRPWLASSGVARRGETFKSVAFGCISLHSLSSTRGRDARFPPSRERRREPLLYADVGAIPGVERLSGVRRSGKTFNSVAFGCISAHSSRRPGAGIRDARFPPSRERRNDFAETTHTTNVRAGGAMAQWAVVVDVGRGVAERRVGGG